MSQTQLYICVLCRLNWSEVKPRTQCRLDPTYIPVRKGQQPRASADQAGDQEEAGATSPKGSLTRGHSRLALLHRLCPNRITHTSQCRSVYEMPWWCHAYLSDPTATATVLAEFKTCAAEPYHGSISFFVVADTLQYVS